MGPTFTGIASAYSLSVSNNLLAQGTTILNKINDTVAIVNNKANTADVANTYAPNFDSKTPLLWELDPLLTTPKLMIDASAFSTAQGLVNLEASITIVGTDLLNNYHTKTQTDGF